MSWGGHPGGAPISMLQNFHHSIRFELFLTDLHQGSHDAATHLIKKTIAFDNESQETPRPLNLAARDGAHGGFHFISPRPGERFEIVFAEEQAGRGSHHVA